MEIEEDELEKVVRLYFEGHSITEALEIARKKSGPFGEDPQEQIKKYPRTL